MKDSSLKVLPKNVLDFYLALPQQYFSFSVCGLPDTRRARIQNIVKKNLEHGYIKFEEECIGSFNEFVLYKDDITKTAILALTKYKGDMRQSLYLLEFNNGEWSDVKDQRFPDLKDLHKNIDAHLPSFNPSTQEEIKRIKAENNNTVPVEFVFSEQNSDIQVILDPEITNDKSVVATIKWVVTKFEIQ